MLLPTPAAPVSRIDGRGTLGYRPIHSDLELLDSLSLPDDMVEGWRGGVRGRGVVSHLWISVSGFQISVPVSGVRKARGRVKPGITWPDPRRDQVRTDR